MVAKTSENVYTLRSKFFILFASKTNNCGHFRIIRLLFPVIQSLKGSLVLKVYFYYNLPLVKLVYIFL